MLEVDDPALQRDRDRMRPVVRAELVQDSRLQKSKSLAASLEPLTAPGDDGCIAADPESSERIVGSAFWPNLSSAMHTIGSRFRPELAPILSRAVQGQPFKMDPGTSAATSVARE